MPVGDGCVEVLLLESDDVDDGMCVVESAIVVVVVSGDNLLEDVVRG